MEFIKLNNGLDMPIIGLGTYPLNRFALIKAAWYAYKNGCVSFDTSSAYGNERWLGIAIRILKFFGAESIFITTKLSNQDQRCGDIKRALYNSMKRLGVKHIDLYLMHWPNPDTYLNSWKEMEKLYRDGLVGAIGVCNFHEHHLEELLKIAKVVPVINQIELHPLLTQSQLRKVCLNNGIQIQSYSPIARMNPKLIKHNVLISLAKKYCKTVPQIILRWNIQSNIVTIPKSGNKTRIQENFSIFDFELTSDEMNEIENINENYRVRYNPDTADYSKL